MAPDDDKIRPRDAMTSAHSDRDGPASHETSRASDLARSGETPSSETASCETASCETASCETHVHRFDRLRRVAALALVIFALGLPINQLASYALLVVAAVLIVTGDVHAQARRWAAAAALVAVAILGQMLVAAPRIEEGHNVFIIDGAGGALEAGLPPVAFRIMAAQFDARYPADRRCDPRVEGCRRPLGLPARPFALSADALLDRPALSRRVSEIDFDDPIWLRLGFTNERQYNWWDGVSDIHRVDRDRQSWRVFGRWQILLPWFVMYRFPAELAGSSLCWRGEVLWEGPPDQFAVLDHPAEACRTIEPNDIGGRIFGVAITEGSRLAMHLHQTLPLRLRQLAQGSLALIAVMGVVALLIRCRWRRTVLPLLFIGLAVVVTVAVDASFVGGWRPLDGGDDGLTYEGFARQMLQDLRNGDIGRALEGGESVFFYTPGLRYLLVAERFMFGDTHLGYLALMLLLPFLVLAAFRRFLPSRWALALTLVFLATPIGLLFGSSYVLYVKWAARGFADPAAFLAFLAGFILLVGRTRAGPDGRFGSAFAASLLLALAVFLRPNLVPLAGLLLGWAALLALDARHPARAAGLCIGFLPVFVMALHNWVFGHVFVLFASNATHVTVYMLPLENAWAALRELARFDFTGENARTLMHQIGEYLKGPTESPALMPVHLAAIGLLAWIAARGKTVDPWLRVVAAAIIVQGVLSLFFAVRSRYFFLNWLFSVLIIAQWFERDGIPRLERRFPALTARMADHPIGAWLASRLGALQHMSDGRRLPSKPSP
jgi:hypothetical protein